MIIAAAVPCLSQSPALTTISDTLVGANGTLLVVAQQSFTTPDGYSIPKGYQVSATITNGVVNVSLPPNVGSTPSGTYYVAYFNVNPGGQYEQYWVVPQSATSLKLQTVTWSVPPILSNMVQFAQILPPLNACTNNVPEWTGSGWTCSPVILNVMTTPGDLTVGGTGGAAQRLATGTTSQFLAGGTTWRSILSSDLPASITSSTSGNAATATALAAAPSQCPANDYSTGIGANGGANCAQVAYSQVSGTPATSVTLNTSAPLGGGGSLSLGGTLTLTCAGCLTSVPAPTATVLGGVKSATAGANQFVTGIDTTGALTFAQPSFANLSGAWSAGQAPAGLGVLTTLGDLMYGGTAGATTRLAGQTTTTKDYLSQTGTGTASAAPAWSQIAFGDLSGLLADAQLPADAAKFTGALTAGHCADWSSSGVLTDAGAACGSGSSSWSSLTSPSASLGLSMGADTSTFTFGSALANAFAWLNGTAATSGANQSSPSLEIGGYGWIGGTPASTLDAWTLQDALGTGTNPTSTFTLGHVGTTGALNVLLPAGVTLESGDTGAPGITFGANSLTVNQPLTISGATTGLGGAPGTAPTPASGKNYLANVTAGWEESVNGGAYSLLMTNPFTTLGDVLYAAASGVPTRLAGNTTTAVECLQSTGTGSAANAPTWGTCGAGAVNSGTQYQLAYYAATGTALSGDANVVTDASNNLNAAGAVNAGSTTAQTYCNGGTGGCAGLSEGTAPTDSTASVDRIYADSTCHCLKSENNSTTAYALSQTIATGTATLGTAAISADTCATAVTVAATGVATTDTISWSFNAAPGTGYTAGLTIQPYVTAANVNFLVCNPTAGSLTPAAATLNWAVRR